jgi:hypothetical protein
MASGGHSVTELRASLQNTEAYQEMFLKTLVEKSNAKLTRTRVLGLLKNERTLMPADMLKMGLSHGTI